MIAGICIRCGCATEIIRKGKDDWQVHTDTLKPYCGPTTRCTAPTRRHILADGTLCPDERHTNQ
jgi:hypothetical protein